MCLIKVAHNLSPYFINQTNKYIKSLFLLMLKMHLNNFITLLWSVWEWRMNIVSLYTRFVCNSSRQRHLYMFRNYPKVLGWLFLSRWEQNWLSLQRRFAESMIELNKIKRDRHWDRDWHRLIVQTRFIEILVIRKQSGPNQNQSRLLMRPRSSLSV